MTPGDIRNLLGGYATGTLTDAEKKLLFEAALEDQELFEAIAAEDSLRELLEDSESRGYLLEAIEEGPRSGSLPVVINPAAPAPVPASMSRARKQEGEISKAEVTAAPSPAKPAAPIKFPPPSSNWMRYGAIAASAVVLFGVSFWTLSEFGTSKNQQIASAPVAQPEVPTPASAPAEATASPPEADREKPAPKAANSISDRSVTEGLSAPAGARSTGADKLKKADGPSPEKPKEGADESRLDKRAPAEPVVAAPPPAAPVRQEERKAESTRESVAVEVGSTAQSIDPAATPRQRSNIYSQPNVQMPDGSRPGDASALYFQQQSSNTQQQQQQQQNFARLGELARTTGSARARDQLEDQAAKRRAATPSKDSVPGTSAPAPAAAPSPAKAATQAAASNETPGVRYQVLRRDDQSRWIVVPAAATFRTGDEIALRVEQNVPGEVRVFYQDQSLRPVALALLDDAAAKRTAPFRLAAPGLAQFTIVLRGPATGAAIPTAPPASQVAEAEGTANYVVRPNAPANSPVVARISLTVR